MATINTFQDLKRILVENPDWLNELRQIILTHELMTLPARFEEFKQSTNERLDSLAAMITENRRLIEGNSGQIEGNRRLIEGNRRLIEGNSGQIEGLRSELDAVKIDVGELKGRSLEGKLASQGFSKVSASLGLGRDRLLRPPSYGRPSQEFNDALWDGLTSGVITRTEYDRLLDTDAIIQTTGNMNGRSGPAYIVVEASFTANWDDLDRVLKSAAALGKLFAEVPIHAALYCCAIPDQLRAEAERQNAAIIIERTFR